MEMEKMTASELERGDQGDTAAPPNRKSGRWSAKIIGVILGFSYLAIRGPLFTSQLPCAYDGESGSVSESHGHPHPHHQNGEGCPYQPDPLHPRLTWNVTDEEKATSVDHFSQAVRIPTQSYDDNGEPADDERWEPFRVFQGWLELTYLLAWKTAQVEFINELGILATFKGSDPSLKPLILMSHYDVVPAPNSTADRWTHAPFSGYNDGTHIWGRGAADDKSLLVAQWEAISHLLANGFEPRRTLILSHGFDEEEVFARRGQGTIAPFLEKRYGANGILMVIDEGSGTSDDFYGAPFALPNMGEKGYMDIKITVQTTGGHSSVPPKHTGIGIMATVISALEDNPFENKLTIASPYLTTLQCAAKHSPSFPKSMGSLLKSEGPRRWPKLAKKLARTSNFERAMLGTTTAVDVINGGVKINALPEVVTSLVNFRIDFDESISFAKAHVEGLLEKVAKHHGLAFDGFETKGNGTVGGMGISVKLVGDALEPAPRTPASGPVWELFAGTVKAAIPGPGGKDRIVAPYASTGNTDCKMYYNLSKNVYRFAAGPSEGSDGVHTVDERSSIKGFYQIIHWVHAIVQNTDAYTGAE